MRQTDKPYIQAVMLSVLGGSFCCMERGGWRWDFLTDRNLGKDQRYL